MIVHLIPAYGRDYTSKRAVLADWNKGKDFYVSTFGHPYDGKPANKESFVNQTGWVNIRYNAQRQVAVIRLGK